jgi:hypothetical protein
MVVVNEKSMMAGVCFGFTSNGSMPNSFLSRNWQYTKIRCKRFFDVFGHIVRVFLPATNRRVTSAAMPIEPVICFGDCQSNNQTNNQSNNQTM